MHPAALHVSSRPLLIGPDAPESPYPIRVEGEVIKGFGRGSKELGIPTANLPEHAIASVLEHAESGVYYGWAKIIPKDEAAVAQPVYPMVLSLGFNPYYNNTVRSLEVHVLHKFPQDFYGSTLKIVILGFIRPEQNYPSLEALIDDINFDGKVAQKCLERPAYAVLKDDEFFAAQPKLGA
ncbi:riboflavin kinase [Saitoella complicata NRRL Y-17804]|uniref:Riboflavin kinase n=1 Tax=Saitoella complicata (strain BCRC 22490 / CBS 7301 / JCM 7358 / NBRC 10748 / NRRL Y-17804) TaxID=698492 RepID=A0A0E9NML0_SAICN|nr:riboflavin kinase [Saitoella complicata NRRL Y-17804]ODQ51722.1 riboflavin kinase [Saitoella complicata NRRL Y-17804]GAO50660.1 hypothetical protein G7K_4782-t1 [Saitoella complicata NRRL Y-17804]